MLTRIISCALSSTHSKYNPAYRKTCQSLRANSPPDAKGYPSPILSIFNLYLPIPHRLTKNLRRNPVTTVLPSNQKITTMPCTGQYLATRPNAPHREFHRAADPRCACRHVATKPLNTAGNATWQQSQRYFATSQHCAANPKTQPSRHTNSEPPAQLAHFATNPGHQRPLVKGACRLH